MRQDNRRDQMAESIAERICLLRGERIILDVDLASMYGLSTGNLNLAVRRNIERFPSDFMFQLTHEETVALRLQIAISNQRGGRRYSRLELTFRPTGSLRRSPTF
jgi:hypothetical protein